MMRGSGHAHRALCIERSMTYHTLLSTTRRTLILIVLVHRGNPDTTPTHYRYSGVSCLLMRDGYFGDAVELQYIQVCTLTTLVCGPT